MYQKNDLVKNFAEQNRHRGLAVFKLALLRQSEGLVRSVIPPLCSDVGLLKRPLATVGLASTSNQIEGHTIAYKVIQNISKVKTCDDLMLTMMSSQMKL